MNISGVMQDSKLNFQLTQSQAGFLTKRLFVRVNGNLSLKVQVSVIAA